MSDSVIFFFSSRRRHTRLQGDWSSDVCLPILETTRGRRASPVSRQRRLRNHPSRGRVGNRDAERNQVRRRKVEIQRSEERRVGKEDRRWEEQERERTENAIRNVGIEGERK